jgi:acetyl-CoA C-acetyltransferase
MTGDAFVLAGLRTPRGKGSSKGALAKVPPVRLLDGVVRALCERVDLRGTSDVIVGCASQTGVQGANLARTAALLAGLGDGVPGVTINRFCASGLDAVNLAAARIRSGDGDLYVAGGVESVSQVPLFADGGPLFSDTAVKAAIGSVHMGVSADLVATMEGFARDDLDAYALRSREKARVAWASGRAATSVVPVRGPAREILLDHDELVSYAPTTEEMALLPPAFVELGASGQDAVACARHGLPEIRHLHTRATSPAPADAAALLVLGSRARASALGVPPRARIVATVTRAVDPVTMLTAGQHATVAVLERAGLRAADVAVFMFAEAFSALCVKFQRDLDVGHDRLNPYGGSMVLGHAFGATGAILAIEVVDALEERGERYGVATVSGAAGLGVAALFERVSH